jgi:hypothetical protein
LGRAGAKKSVKKSGLNEALEWSCLSEMKSCEFASATMVDNCVLNCIFGNLYLQHPFELFLVDQLVYRVRRSPSRNVAILTLAALAAR